MGNSKRAEETAGGRANVQLLGSSSFSPPLTDAQGCQSWWQVATIETTSSALLAE